MLVQEILHEIAAEVAAAPLRLVAEVVQFFLLAILVWVVAIGVGKRRGFVANMLLERRAKMGARIESASSSEADLTHAKQLSSLQLRTARTEGRRIIAEARRESAEIDAQAAAEADAEAERIIGRAEEALQTELAEMHLNIREELVEVVSQATRTVMNERLTVPEQRRLIETAVLSSVDKAKAEEPQRDEGDDQRLSALPAEA